MATGLCVLAWAGPAWAEPAVLYIPDEDIQLSPLGIAPCTAQINSATGCIGDDPVGVPAYADVAGLRASMAAALAPYDVYLAEERPPEYLAYTMLLPSDDPRMESESFTCSTGGINCGARKRNSIVRVHGSTPFCPVFDPVATSLYAFGRISGLEGVADPLDAMHFVPDFGMGGGGFTDACLTIVHQIGVDDEGGLVELPLECTSLDHVDCPPQQQNGHADLLAHYGPRVVDLDPPVASNILPEDGTYFPEGADIELSVELDDADPVLGGRWTIASPVLEDFFEDGQITQCTNDVCTVDWDDASPLKPTASDWDLILSNLPEGEYEVTFEASDFHGNVMAPIFLVFFVGEEPPSDDTTTIGPADTGVFTTGSVPPATSTTTTSTTAVTLDGSGGVGSAEGPGPSGGSSGPGENDGLVDHGCVCRSSPSSGWRWGGLLLMAGALRRRREGRRGRARSAGCPRDRMQR